MVAAKSTKPTKVSRAGATAPKSAAKKTAAKKTAAKKTVPKKAVPKKAVPKKAVPKKIAAAKTQSKPVSKSSTSTKAAKKSAPVAKKSAKVADKKIIIPKKVANKVPVKKASQKPIAAKLQSTTQGDSTTITVTPHEVNSGPEVIIEERRLAMIPPPRPVRHGKKTTTLKPIKGAPAPLVVNESENPWNAAELKSMKAALLKELVRLKSELVDVEGEMEDLISAAGVGAGDDQADAGTKTFEREHEMSLVYNARDMVLQTERAIERIDTKTYGRCEECSQAIGKERLQVFPRATLCMACKQKEERR